MSLGNRLTLWILCLPLALMAVAVVVLHQDTEWRKSAMKERLTLAAELQASSLAAALAEQDSQRLDGLARRLLAIEEARGIGVYASSGEAILELGRGDTPAAAATTPPETTRLDDHSDLWRLLVPLHGVERRAGNPPQAWLEIDIDTRTLTLDHYRRLASTGLVLLVLGLGLFLLGSSLGRRLDASLRDASSALQRLRHGDSHARLSEEGPAELGQLAAQVNALGDELQQSRDNMQRQIEQTTADLQESMETIEIKNIELDLAHRRALEASRIKSEFLASMSHEIRTPLNGIVGFCRLLGRSRLEPRQREWLDQVQVACDNLLALVNDVLDFSRIEAGRLELDRAELDMVNLVDEALSLQAPLAHQKDLQLLGLVYDDVPAALRGDPLRIRQVLTNLVHNALKFTDQGEVIVRVMVEESTGPGQVVLRISISDTGIGLSLQEQHELFQAFRQATPSHPRHYGGSGLGLAISRQLVEQMGGQISVESEPGRGSTFAFTLPLDSSDQPAPPPEPILDGACVALHEPHAPSRHALRHLLGRWGARVVEIDTPRRAVPEATLMIAALPGRLTSQQLEEWQERLSAAPCPVLLLANTSPLELPELNLPGGGEILCKPLPRHTLADALRRQNEAQASAGAAPGQPRLMVVDDNASNRRLLSELLKRPGLTIEQAASGEEALALAESARFDLVLMDIRMPGIDGVETTRALRRLGAGWAKCPVIAVTAHALEEDRRQLLEAGLQGILIKPVDANELEGVLHRYLGLAATQPHAVADSPAKPDPAASGDLATVDLTLGTRLANGSESLARELLDELARSLPTSEAELRAALVANDEEGLLDAVHALNGACRYCGAPALALVAETLETRLRSRGMADIAALVDELFLAMERLKAWHAAQPSSTTMASASSASSDSDR
ncbi:response regulator [Halomonas campisalis]|uniref:histidine kinase n=1 Tax=Billgrantia campisalis TaxID=74661 RepID=A0ABS9P8F0_9GAMM|nr:ATP-binding protein [Halomonas campisalis]MCG6657896.1 response regulator [Halomonas campisalis]MDR5863580.1 ATP-binding protein [Halomonas campisalis]